jgi:hypothetical protein
MLSSGLAAARQMEDALANNADIREATYEAPLQPASSALCAREAYVAVAAHAGDLNGEDSGAPAALGRSEVNAAQVLDRQWLAFCTA